MKTTLMKLLSAQCLSGQRAALFTHLLNEEEEHLSGGSVEMHLALPVQTTPPAPKPSGKYIATDAKGNGITLEQLLDYIVRTVGVGW